MLESGKLNRRITIQILTTTKSETGAIEEVWTDWDHQVWAEMRDFTGRERYNANEQVGDLDTTFLFRYERALDLKPKDRIVWNDRVYDIQFIARMGEMNELMQATCLYKEGV